MSAAIKTCKFTLTPNDPRRLVSTCGPFNENLHQIEKSLSLHIKQRGNQFEICGETHACEMARDILVQLHKDAEDNNDITPEMVHLSVQEFSQKTNHKVNNGKRPIDSNKEASTASMSTVRKTVDDISIIRTPLATIKLRGDNQNQYVKNIFNYDINFGIGPAGTGKTFIAVACAVHALEQEQVQRILLVRPAVEAGEKLGFLPGDLADKVNPYLRPLYDALYEMLGFEKVSKLIERQVIEIAPLAYMRGRTLNNSFIILDESQNTTQEQMKMFLTRIGFGSKAVITGDLTQIDLPKGLISGLRQGLEVLADINEIGIIRFQPKDVLRHRLVQRIVEAYDAFDQIQAKP